MESTLPYSWLRLKVSRKKLILKKKFPEGGWPPGRRSVIDIYILIRIFSFISRITTHVSSGTIGGKREWSWADFFFRGRAVKNLILGGVYDLPAATPMIQG